MKSKTICRWMALGLVSAGLMGIGVRAAEERTPDVAAIRVATPPKIDGMLDDAAWKEVQQNKKCVMDNWRPWNFSKALDKPLAYPRVAYVCYDQGNLYVGMKASVPDIYKLKAGSNAFAGDCLEIHINTPEGRYYQYAIDFEGTITPGEVPSGTDSKLVKGKSELGSNSWATEMAIPWKLLGIPPKTGLRVGFNLAANFADQGKDAWTPITWGKSFTVKNNETLLELK
jgi:hypothetical protein